MDEAEVAEKVADALEEHLELSEAFQMVDWNDLGEVTIRAGGKTFRLFVRDITAEG